MGKTNDFAVTDVQPPKFKISDKEKELILSYRKLSGKMKTLFFETINVWGKFSE